MIQAFTLAILGASGKMGREVEALASQDPHVTVVAKTGSSHRPCPPFSTAENALALCDVAIDFSQPLATSEHLKAALVSRKPLVIGTTGHTKERLEQIRRASLEIPDLSYLQLQCGHCAPHTDRKVPSASLHGTAHVRIEETHHTEKKDSPSGTALMIAEEIGGNPEIRSNRIAGVVGTHTLSFEWGQERLEVSHQALSRSIFAKGALIAAKFLLDKPPGFYTHLDLKFYP